MNDPMKDLSASAWAHIEAKRFDRAEAVLRELIERIDPDDVQRRWHCYGLLAGVLNSLDRVDEGTKMYRKALEEARRLREPGTEGVSRYMLGNQYLLFGDARDALETVEPVPEGVGHLQCLLHSVAAEALWKVEKGTKHERALGSPSTHLPTTRGARRFLSNSLTSSARAEGRHANGVPS